MGAGVLAALGGSLTMDRKETPQEYAQRRANETGIAYIVSDQGHAMADCPHNRRAIRDMECVVAARFVPSKGI